ncbi:ABC transporter [Actinomadura rubrobrunea]|uniref:ABC transporter n=1 Tax=Actinomadura rubrobrunea TaxID=115335 RepID=A0A9W6UUF6_9ACTN|nr:ABC transporter ATP-binding protein [Actinomadura rubrobrunea]GLW62222.1 ABC transporter [Actinomadura rubrobrunea]
MKRLPVPDPGVPDGRSPTRYLIWTARAQWRAVLAGALLDVGWTACQALMLAAIGKAVDEGVAERDASALAAWSAVVLALGGGVAATGVLRHRTLVLGWLSAAYRTVQIVTRQAVRLGGTLPRRTAAGEVVSVGVTDVEHIGDALEILGRAVGATTAIGLVTGLMWAASPRLGLVVLIGVPVILAAAGPLLRPLREREQRHRELVGELNSRAADLVAGLRVLRGIGGEALFADRYREESQRVRRAGVAAATAASRLRGAEVLLPGLLVALVTWAGARAAASGAISVGDLVACYGYAVFLITPLKTVGEAAGTLTRGHVAAGRVVRLLRLEPEPPDTGTVVPDGPAELVDAASGLVVRPGRVTAIAASDPRDAQAIADRLGRHADGEVAYGGVPLRDVAGVRERIVVALNEDRLFSGTLRDALTPGFRPVDDAALHAALRTACAEDVAAATGLDARVAEAGREFSGGQLQRLRLARALAADPEVLVLVEPTSAVDAHTEARIADRLGAARAGRTTVVCTTSPLMLDRADHVAFVVNGAVVAEGRHRDLLLSEPRYAAAVTRGEDSP